MEVLTIQKKMVFSFSPVMQKPNTMGDPNAKSYGILGRLPFFSPCFGKTKLHSIKEYIIAKKKMITIKFYFKKT